MAATLAAVKACQRGKPCGIADNRPGRHMKCRLAAPSSSCRIVPRIAEAFVVGVRLMRMLKCYAEGRPGSWESICLDFDIAAQGDSFEDVFRSLSKAIELYLETVRELPEEERRRFLGRRAPSCSSPWPREISRVHSHPRSPRLRPQAPKRESSPIRGVCRRTAAARDRGGPRPQRRHRPERSCVDDPASGLRKSIFRG